MTQEANSDNGAPSGCVDPEAEFYAAWRDRYAKQQMVSRDDLQVLLCDDHRLGSAIGTLVRRLAENEQLSTSDAQWLMENVAGDFARRQLEAYLVISDDAAGWLDKLAEVARLDVRWAVEQLLSEMQPDMLEKALAVISKMKSSRRVLSILDRERARSPKPI